jgi:uncharacterized SAM-binding protein YcdF (DUF218 family)
MREILSYSFVMPPTIFIVISLSGAIIAFVRPRFGIILSLSSGIFLYLFATPAVSMLLMHQLVSLVPTKVDFTDAQAIVVPGVDVKWGNDADIPDSVGVLTLERLASAAQLYRRLRLPVLVSGGGDPGHPNNSLANLMRLELEQNFHVVVQFFEEKSRNTFEQGLYTSHILKESKICNVIVIAQEKAYPVVPGAGHRGSRGRFEGRGEGAASLVAKGADRANWPPRRDQQGAVADHLCQTMPNPLRRARVLDAIGQSLGDPEPLLDRRQEQFVVNAAN